MFCPNSLTELTLEFSKAFNHPLIPPLPKLLSQISTSSSTHFYGAVVRAKDMVPVYHDAIIWLLKRDLLAALHLRVRIVATVALKDKVRMRRELARARRERIRRRSMSAARRAPRARRGSAGAHSEGAAPGDAADASPVDYWMSMSPKSARRQARAMSPPAPARGGRRERSLSVLYHLDEKRGAPGEDEDEDEDVFLEDDLEVASMDTDEARAQAWDEARPSMIADPARATPLERQWLAAMSEGKDPSIARRFQQ